ncbi:MAG: hypothetical protein ACRD2J_16280 [Thermoanaerobaculia bacterium]
MEPAPGAPPLWDSIRDGSRYFAGEGKLHETVRRLVARLEEEAIPYAIVGGLALLAHGYRRLTEDIDVLLTEPGLERMRERMIGRGLRPAFEGAGSTFRDAETGIRIEVVKTGDYPGDGKPKPVRFPDPERARERREGIWIIPLPALVELKLASGLSAPHRLKDLADVQELIAARDLPRDLADDLDASVRTKYLELWDAVGNR